MVDAGPGLQGRGSLAIDGSGRLHVGGSFAAAGDVLASGIARWDGATWSAFGTGGGLNGPVFAMATDGQGNVVAGGDFTVAGGGPASHRQLERDKLGPGLPRPQRPREGPGHHGRWPGLCGRRLHHVRQRFHRPRGLLGRDSVGDPG
ncbi:MAG: hypothetical protein IPI48_04280 [bacterium]|nr:hypothetical protein [bacterium]